jgi:hypothetical protein
MAASMNAFLLKADTTVVWDKTTTKYRKNSLIIAIPGSAHHTAFGGAGNLVAVPSGDTSVAEHAGISN